MFLKALIITLFSFDLFGAFIFEPKIGTGIGILESTIETDEYNSNSERDLYNMTAGLSVYYLKKGLFIGPNARYSFGYLDYSDVPTSDTDNSYTAKSSFTRRLVGLDVGLSANNGKMVLWVGAYPITTMSINKGINPRYGEVILEGYTYNFGFGIMNKSRVKYNFEVLYFNVNHVKTGLANGTPPLEIDDETFKSLSQIELQLSLSWPI